MALLPSSLDMEIRFILLPIIRRVICAVSALLFIPVGHSCVNKICLLYLIFVKRLIGTDSAIYHQFILSFEPM